MRSRPSTNSQPSGKRFWLLVPLLLLIACGVGGFIWWQHYKTTPAYSLALLVDAAQRNDTLALDELLDINQVVENFVTDVVGNTAKDSATSIPNSLRSAFSQIAGGTRERIKPLIIETIRQKINELGAQAANKPFLLTALAMPFKTNIVEDGNKATATLNRKDEKLELGLLRNNDGHWSVVSLKDDALAARIIAEVAKDLPGKLKPEGLSKPWPGILPPGIPLIPER